MRPGQFQLRTLLILTAGVCIHSALAAANQEAFCYLILFSTPVMCMFLALRGLRVTMRTAVLGTTFSAPILVAAIYSVTWIEYGLIFPALIGAVFSIVTSAWVAAIWWSTRAARTMIRDRSDLYFVRDN